MRLIKREKGDFYEDNLFEHKGHTIEEHYFVDDDKCTHHSATVYQGDQELAHFNWEGALQKAINYIDKRVDQ